jgi:hypothetical protein
MDVSHLHSVSSVQFPGFVDSGPVDTVFILIRDFLPCPTEEVCPAFSYMVGQNRDGFLR